MLLSIPGDKSPGYFRLPLTWLFLWLARVNSARRITVLLAAVLLITATGQRLSFQGRADRLYDSYLPVALPAALAIAGAAPHLNLEEHSHLGCGGAGGHPTCR